MVVCRDVVVEWLIVVKEKFLLEVLTKAKQVFANVHW